MYLVLGPMPANASPESHVASGPWCFAGQEDRFPNWENEYKFAPEPLANKTMASTAVKAAQFLGVKTIPKIAGLLTAEPDNLPEEYWQILLAPWIMDVACQIIDRALRAQAMVVEFGNMPLTVELLPEDCVFKFSDDHDFTLRGSLGQLFNQWLFSRLLEHIWPEQWQKVLLPAQALIAEPEAALDFGKIKDKFKSVAKNLAYNLAFPLMRGISVTEAWKLASCLDHICRGQDRSLDLKKTFNFPKELDQIHLPDNVLTIFEKALPESLRALQHKPAPKDKAAPRLKIAGIAAAENAVYRQNLAKWRASGNRLAHCQHGGNYGQVASPCTAAVVEYGQAAFFTWGWQSQGQAQGNFVPMPSPLLSEQKNWDGGSGNSLIFVGTEMAAWGHRLDSHPTPLEFVAYRKAKAIFLANLDSEIREKTFYRPYFELPGTLADAQWLLPQFPEVRQCIGSLESKLQSCNLLVLDHHGTTLLEAMAADIPMVLYWDRGAWPLTPECNVLLDILAEAGIWFNSPETAAEKVNLIWQNTAEWWQSAEIRMARKVFCKHQALYSSDWESVWQERLREL